jgi:hypothetical protein
MTSPPSSVEDRIKLALQEVHPLVQCAFAQVGGVAVPGSALDQNGLLDGAEIVLEYLARGEAGLALEHLVYMVREPGLAISATTYRLIEVAGREMEMDSKLWEGLKRETHIESP